MSSGGRSSRLTRHPTQRTIKKPQRRLWPDPTPFKDILGKTTTLGLLPVCGDNDNFWGLAWLRHRAAPCVESITLDRLGNVTETVRLPAYDPRMH
jgi:hypothetical protein